MANEGDTAASATETQTAVTQQATQQPEQQTQQPVQQPATYPRKELIARSKEIFGVNPEIVVGALHGDNSKEFTIDQIKQKIKDFMERKVK